MEQARLVIGAHNGEGLARVGDAVGEQDTAAAQGEGVHERLGGAVEDAGLRRLWLQHTIELNGLAELAVGVRV